MLTNDLRIIIQTKLQEIVGLQSGVIRPEEMIEDNIYYFGYNVVTSVVDRDLSYDNNHYTISLVGYLSVSGGTQKEFDNFNDSICSKLLSLNFRPTVNQNPIDNKVRKSTITAYVQLNTLDELLR